MVKTSSKNFLLYVIFFVSVIAAIFALSYALFRYYRLSTTSSTIQSGTIKLRYKESNNVIDITDIYPMDDEFALNSEINYYEFYVDYTINDDAKITYGIYIDNQTSTLDEIVDNSFTEIPSKMIKFALDDVTNNSIVVNPTFYSNIKLNDFINDVGHLLYSKEVTGNNTDTYRIYMWVPELDADNNEIIESDLSKKTFSFFINVKAIASVEN